MNKDDSSIIKKEWYGIKLWPLDQLHLRKDAKNGKCYFCGGKDIMGELVGFKKGTRTTIVNGHVECNTCGTYMTEPCFIKKMNDPAVSSEKKKEMGNLVRGYNDQGKTPVFFIPDDSIAESIS